LRPSEGASKPRNNKTPKILNKKEGLKEKRKAAREAKTRPRAHKPPDLKEKRTNRYFYRRNKKLDFRP
jgi:hypothetical protein